MAILALIVEPVGAMVEDVADPVQRLDIVDQCRAPEDADLGNIGRAVARQAALALDGFDHRRFLAADIGAGAAPKLDLDMVAQAGGTDPVELLPEKGDDFGIFVPHVDEAALDPDDMRRDQNALNHTVWIRRKVQPVLEGSGFAFIAVHRHQTGAGLAADDAPFAPGRETRAAKAAKRRAVQGVECGIACALAGEKFTKDPVAALFAVLVEQTGPVRRQHGGGVRHAGKFVQGRRRDELVADGGSRRLVAGADAGRGDEPHISAGPGLKRLEKLFAAGHHAGQRGADPYRTGRRGCFALANKVEMVVEAGDFPDFGHGKAHPVGKRRKMTRRQMPEPVLDGMKAFDQQIAARRCRAEKLLDFRQGCGIDESPLRFVIALAAA